MVNAQEWLDENYPTFEAKATARRVDINRIGDHLINYRDLLRGSNSFYFHPYM